MILLNNILKLALLTFMTLSCAYSKESRHFPPYKIHKIQLDYANVYIVDYKKKLLLIDSGRQKDFKKFKEYLHDLNYQLKDIQLVILTHGHEDHAGAGKLFQEEGIPIIAGLADKPLLNQGKNNTLCPTSQLAKYMISDFQKASFSPYEANLYISSNKSLELLDKFGFPIIVYHVGNHTPGSLVVEIPSAKVMFLGDLARGDGPFHSQTGEIHFYLCDLHENQEKLTKLLSSSMAETFYTGHFGPINRREVQAVIKKLEARKK
ncbi:MAG: MBL fold metallo-hydrolase [Spirochaetota bacterium]